jgi:hypothetical protein
MNVLVHICVFLIVLFLYVYVMNQFKKSEDLDIYEMDYSSNQNLQEICEIRQPVLFNFYAVNPNFFYDLSNRSIAKYGSYDVKIKDAHDYYKENKNVESVALSLASTLNLFENDNASHFFSENNEDFLDESGALKVVQTMDEFLKPTFTIHRNYDLLFGSLNSVTPLRYHTHYRQYLCVTSGKINVKMTPWKSHKYLYPIVDYENYEFRSPVHPIHPQSHYLKDYEKTKFVEFEVLKGYVLYIPPYWWYSIEYSEVNTFVAGVSYTTVMNSVSNLPNIMIHWLQQQNITKKITKIPEKKSPLVEISPAFTDQLADTSSSHVEPIDVSQLTYKGAPENQEQVKETNREENPPVQPSVEEEPIGKASSDVNDGPVLDNI